ncbi:MAG: biotin--[acetyl-CoA-carboxylase] ligase [Thermoplasmatota archaeon]
MRDRILGYLRDSEFVSGESMADELGISRTAVWKHVNSLKAMGYDIESVKNKGYRLVSSPDKPISEEVTRDLGTEIIGSEVRYLPTIDSTNILGKELARSKIPEGCVIVADEQTMGRGRKNRSWSSPKGGLWFSVILYPDLPPERGMLVTMMTSISVAEAVKELTGIDPVIKWPNDLLIKGKKVCGILTELDAEMDRIESSVIGIGINVNNEIDPDLADIGTSLKNVSGKVVSRVDLIRSVLKHMDENYGSIRRGDHDSIRSRWLELSRITGRKIRHTGPKGIRTGTVLDIDDSGCIIMKIGGGSERIVSGDVEYLDD